MPTLADCVKAGYEQRHQQELANQIFNQLPSFEDIMREKKRQIMVSFFQDNRPGWAHGTMRCASERISYANWQRKIRGYYVDNGYEETQNSSVFTKECVRKLCTTI